MTLYVWASAYDFSGRPVHKWHRADFLPTPEAIGHFREEMRSRGFCTLLARDKEALPLPTPQGGSQPQERPI